jgi:putative Mg2+ transporter-C (MgtC) family protein
VTPHDVSLADALARLAIAFALALPLGWERETRARPAGLRTYPLLSVCACGFLLLPQGTAWGLGAQANVFYGLLGGIGFVASGAILKSPRRSRGMNTAVTLWVTGAIAAGAAYGAAQISAAVAVISLVALRAPTSLVQRRWGAS